MLTPIIELRGVEKAYGGLRPLRVQSLVVPAGETVVLEGPDETAASVLVDLLTATTLPDAGEVLVSGRATASVSDQEAWLAFLDQFGIVNGRVVLLDELTVLQNLAVPLTLDLEPLPEAVRRRAVELAGVAGLDSVALDTRLGRSSGLTRLLVRIGRALAHDPRILLVEHPTAELAAAEIPQAADALAAAARGRAMLVVSSDERLGQHLACTRLTWKAATGEVKARQRGWWRGR